MTELDIDVEGILEELDMEESELYDPEDASRAISDLIPKREGIGGAISVEGWDDC